MDDNIKELVLKHEREISQLTALQQIIAEQTDKLTASIEAMSKAIVEIKAVLETQNQELKTALDMKKELVEMSKSFILDKEHQRETNKRTFERIERLEGEVQELNSKIDELIASTTLARWLDGGFKVLSKKAAVYILLILGLMVLAAFLGVDLHNFIRSK